MKTSQRTRGSVDPICRTKGRLDSTCSKKDQHHIHQSTEVLFDIYMFRCAERFQTRFCLFFDCFSHCVRNSLMYRKPTGTTLAGSADCHTRLAQKLSVNASFLQ